MSDLGYGGHPGADQWADVDDVVHDPDAPRTLLGKLRDGAWLDQQMFDPITFIVEGIIPEGATILAGAPKVGKSWLMLSIGLAVATGGRALGHLRVGAARPVLYLALEDSDRRLQDRCRQVLGDRPIPALFQYMTEIEGGQCVATINEWMQINGHTKPLVVVDTLGRVMPSARNGETNYQRDYRTVGALQALITPWPGAGMVIVHHTRKAGAEDYADRISGTQGLLGAADTGVILTRSRSEQAGLLNVTGRDVEENDYSLELRDGLWLLEGGSLADARAAVDRRKATAKLGDRSSEVYDYVAANPGTGPTQVGQKFGMTASDAGNYLLRLAESGRLVRKGRGKYFVSTLSTLSTEVPGSRSNVVPLKSVETVESVEMPDQSVSTGSTDSTPGCERCSQPSSEPLVLGRCQRCAYPGEQFDDGPEAS